MTVGRTADFVAHMRSAAEDAIAFIEGIGRVDFLADRRTQQAVVMSLVIIGEASSKIMDNDPEFADRHPQVPWRAMRGMRNRIAHGYFEINFDVVWDPVRTALPDLLAKLPH